MESIPFNGLDQAAVTAWSEALGDPEWFRARRLEALEALEKLERPSGREEDWRFTNPRAGGLDRAQVIRSGGPAAAGTELAAGGLLASVDGMDGRATLAPDLAAKGVVLTDLATALREHASLVEPRFMTAAAPYGDDWFLAVHATLVSSGVFLYVPRGVQVDLAIGALYRRTRPGATFAHTLVVVEDDAEVTFVQQHGSPEELGGRAFHHGVTEVLVGERARVQHLTLQEWGSEQVVHFGVQRALVAREGSYRSLVVTLGGGVVRIAPDARLAEGAETDFLGATFADEGQRFEHRATVTHAEPFTRSTLLYKGGLLGGARNIFNGTLSISPGARGSDAAQTMRNLVLSRHAHAEANPFLEILNSDVRAAHAAATGRVDDQHLFYLQSRGIPRDQARRLVVFGFFEEILEQVGVPAVRRRLEDALEAELEKEVAS
jgi:Fe-S cluster assembly protein SufD